MNQSNVIFAYLLIAFIVFITMRGELRTYMGFFFGGGASPQASGSPRASARPQQSASNSNGAKAGDLAELAKLALAFV